MSWTEVEASVAEDAGDRASQEIRRDNLNKLGN